VVEVIVRDAANRNIFERGGHLSEENLGCRQHTI
jgi:hypothetical protein